MLTVTENTTQQINAALFEQDQNVKNKLSTVSGVVSAVYGACEWIFNKLKESLARVATTGSYNDLTDKPTIVDTVAQNVPNAVSSNAVYGALTNVIKKKSMSVTTSGSGSASLNLTSSQVPVAIRVPTDGTMTEFIALPYFYKDELRWYAKFVNNGLSALSNRTFDIIVLYSEYISSN